MNMVNNFFDGGVYCINVLKDVERYKKVNERFKKMNLDVIRVDAFTPNYMDVKLDFLNCVDGELIDPSFNIRVLSAFKSHLKVLKHFRDNVKGDHILIFEDDIIFHKDFDNLFNLQSQNLPENWGVWYLGGFEWRADLIDHNTNPLFYKPIGFTAGLFAYAIHRRFINTFIEQLEVFYLQKMAVDFAVFRFLQNKLDNIYVSKQNIIGHDYVVSNTQNKIADDTRVWFPIDIYDY